MCIALYNLLLVPDSSSLVVPIRHDHRRRSQPVRKHADDAGPGAELQDRFPGQVQLEFSRAGVRLGVSALLVVAVGAMLHKVGAQQERAFPESLSADLLAALADTYRCTSVGGKGGSRERRAGWQTAVQAVKLIIVVAQQQF